LPVPQHIDDLFQKYLDNRCSPAEVDELLDYMKTGGFDELYYLHVAGYDQKNYPNDAAVIARLEDRLQQILTPRRGAVRRIPMWTRIAAAACLAVILSTASYFLLFKKNGGVPANEPGSAATIKAPVINRATITLANGRKLYLDSSKNGEIATERNAQIVKRADGQIEYNGHATTNHDVVYNTLFNPKGSRVIDIRLSDGSRVWLNAGSSVTYPTAFAGTERKITIIGEAYFEVTHDAKRPFIVTRDQLDVEVLGTHFNVNAYEDEPGVIVTLLEGSVKVTGHNQQVFLQPGDQARATGQISLLKSVDTAQVMAWKSGWFEFDNTDLATIMRQVSRWYDVEIVYEQNTSGQAFGGRISRKLDLPDVLHMLQSSGVHFRQEGKKIFVRP